ncbi:MAG: acyl-CoA carboxylase epsilon subunit [Solirubrobacterales bacterium]
MNATNGKRRPPRARIELVSGSASDTEVAAIVAALQQFLADTAPTAAPGGAEQSPWQRAALEEGIAARQVSGYAWGHSPLPR